MAQTMYAHMNEWINKPKKFAIKAKKLEHCLSNLNIASTEEEKQREGDEIAFLSFLWSEGKVRNPVEGEWGKMGAWRGKLTSLQWSIKVCYLKSTSWKESSVKDCGFTNIMAQIILLFFITMLSTVHSSQLIIHKLTLQNFLFPWVFHSDGAP
jgi:hypothetical protein